MDTDFLSSFLQVKCSTKNNEISLVPLIKLKDDYILKANGSEFHINVCNTLVSTGSSAACRDSAACLIYKNSNGEVTKEIVSDAVVLIPSYDR